MKNKFNQIYLGLIILIATLLRLFKLDEINVWIDEAYQAFIVKKNLPELMNFIITHDNHPPLYYIFLHFWEKIADNTFFLRIPSVIFSVISIYVLYLIVKEIFDENTALISSLLYSFSFNSIIKAQEIRMYSLLGLEILLIVYSFIKIIKNENNNKYWLLFGISTYLSWMTSYISFIITVIVNIFVIWCRKMDLKKWFIVQISLVVLFVFWINAMIFQYFYVEKNFCASSSMGYLNFFLQTFFYFFSGTVSSFLNNNQQIVVIIFSIIVICYGIIKSFVNKDKNFILLITMCFIMPVVVLFIFKDKIFITRYYSAFIPFYLIFFAYAIVVCKKILTRILVYSVLIIYFILNMYNLNLWYNNPSYQISSWKQAISYLSANIKPDDAIIVEYPSQIYLFKYYFKDKNDIYPLTLDQINTIQKMKKKYKRVWLAYSMGILNDHEKKIPKRLNLLFYYQSMSVFINSNDREKDILIILFNTNKSN